MNEYCPECGHEVVQHYFDWQEPKLCAAPCYCTYTLREVIAIPDLALPDLEPLRSLAVRLAGEDDCEEDDCVYQGVLDNIITVIDNARREVTREWLEGNQPDPSR